MSNRNSGESGPLLEVRGLSKSFGAFQVLDGASFSVGRGEILGVIGPNGAGKTTLLECIAGLLHSDAGEAVFNGLPAGEIRLKESLFYVPDNVRPYAEQTAASVIGLVAALYGLQGGQDDLIKRLGLNDAIRKRMGELSKGTAKRLLLLLGLLTPQPLLLLDEPFDGLDPHQTKAVMEILREVRAAGRTLVLSIHQLTDAEKICDRFFLLASGRTVALGTLEELLLKASLETGGLEDVFFALT